MPNFLAKLLSVFRAGSKEEQRESAGVVFVLLGGRPNPPPSPSDIIQSFEKSFGHAVVGSVEGEDAGSIDVDKKNLVVFRLIPVPVPDGEAERISEGNFLWPDARGSVEAHQSHIMLTLLTSERNKVRRALVLTQASSALLEAFQGMAVYWGAGSIINSRDVFLELSQDSTAEDPPLFLWIRFQPYQTEKQKSAIYTTGLEQFGLREIECDECDWPNSELLDFVYNTACYLLTSGVEVRDGDTVGEDENMKIRARYGKSVRDETRDVLKINFYEA